MPACPGARGHGHALYFSLLFLVNKALDMPGVHGAVDGDGWQWAPTVVGRRTGQEHPPQTHSTLMVQTPA